MYLIFFLSCPTNLTDGDTNICCDELHELLKNCIAISYLLSFIKRGRKRGSNVILASQNVSDFFLPEIVEYTKPLLSIPTHRFLFYPGSCDTEEYKRYSRRFGFRNTG